MWRFSRDRTVHEELVQDVFVEAYLSLGGYGGRAPFGHWLARIATRVGYSYWKRQARRRRTETYSIEEWDRLRERPADGVEAVEAAELVHGLLERLPARDRLVLTLRYIDGCSVAETARRTGWTQALVKVQTWRARKKLQKLLAVEKEGENQ
jgi:RNA polymerase sigma-70 factor (ECF subfamily)